MVMYWMCLHRIADLETSKSQVLRHWLLFPFFSINSYTMLYNVATADIVIQIFLC